MKNWQLAFVVIILACSSVLQGCKGQGGFNAKSSKKIDSASLSIYNSALRGLEIYNQDCMSCHGDVYSWKQKAIPSGTFIVNKINSVSQMQFLIPSITLEEANDISEAIRWGVQNGNFDQPQTETPNNDSNTTTPDPPSQNTPPVSIPYEGDPIVKESVDFSTAKTIIGNACVSCHKGYHNSWKDYSESDFVSEGLIAKGYPQSSELISRIKYYGAPGSNMPEANNTPVGSFGQAEFEKLYNWVDGLEPDGTPNGPTDGSNTSTSGTVSASRKYTASNGNYILDVLKEIYVIDLAAMKNTKSKYYKSLIMDKITFGGACNFYSTQSGKDCGGQESTGMSNAIDGEFSVVKAINKRVICEGTTPDGVSVAAERFSLNTDAAVTDTDIKKVHGLFYRSREIKTEELQAVSQFIQKVKAKGAPPKDQWEFVFLLFCEQPGWEIL